MENTITFTTKAEESLANAVRRYMHQIPMLAIDEVEITKNDSALYDETIAHRMGLIVLKSDKALKDNTEVKLKLNVKKEGNVYAEELKGGAKVVYEKTPITLLNKGQELIVEATARVGKGYEHSKFSPGLMFYRNIIDIKVTKDCPTDVIESCPLGVLKVENGKVAIKDPEKCDMCEACTEWCEQNGKDSVKLVPTRDLFVTVESFGQITPQEMLKQSIDLLKKDLSEVGKKV